MVSFFYPSTAFEMTSFTFWYRWLLLLSAGFAFFGLGVALMPENPLLTLWNRELEKVFARTMLSPESSRIKTFLFGPLGSTIAAYYLMQVFVLLYAFRAKQRWAWWAILSATLLWFAVDTIVSLHHGALFNVLIINLPVLLITVLPLSMTYSAFPGTRD